MRTTIQSKHHDTYSIDVQPLGKHRAKIRNIKAGTTMESLAKTCLIAVSNGLHIVAINAGE